MLGKGIHLTCEKCGAKHELTELGELVGVDRDADFTHIPDWYEWERANVRAEIERGEYRFEDEVEVYSMPRCWKFEKLGKAKLTHTIDGGFVLEGEYRGEKYHIHRTPLQTNSLHVEYDFAPLKAKDFVDISTENDSFYCRVSDPNVITKLGFATEELYLRSQGAKRAQKSQV